MIDDIRNAFAHLRRHPGFLLLGACALGIGLAAAILVFGILNTLLLRPLPGISGEQQQVEIGRIDDNDRFGAVSFPDFRDVRDHATSVEKVFAYHMGPAYLGSGDTPVAALSMLVSGNYFDALDVRAERGQLIRPSHDDVPGRNPVVVLSHAAFEKHFNADPAAIGRTLRINGSQFTVIGVTDPAFKGHIAPVAPELYVPLSMAGAMKVKDDAAWHERYSNWLELGGVLKPGVSIEQAEAELAALSTSLSERQAAYEDPWQFGVVELRPLPQRAHGMIGFLAIGLLVMCAAILALASSNLAGVLLAKGEARAGELATRSALGASRARIVRQLFVESMLVALAAGGIGLLFAMLGRNVLQLVSLPLPFPVDLGIVIDWRVVAFALTTSALVAFAFGLLPALKVSSVSPARAIGSERGGATRKSSGNRSILLASQSALTVLLLLVAALTVLALNRAGDIETGFRTENVRIAHLDLSPLGLTGEAAADELEQLAERVRQFPGVTAASFASVVPLTGEQLGYGPARLPGTEDRGVDMRVNVVGPDFFNVFDIPVQGRPITRDDRENDVKVAVINQRLAERVFGNENPVGREFTMGWREDSERVRVIGVTPNGRYASLAEDDRAFAFLPATQWQRSRFSMFVHGNVDAQTLRQGIATELRALLPDMPPPVIHRFEDAAALSILPQKILGIVATALGVLALLLAATGLYGVLAYQIERRFREFGVRRALGASSLQVSRALMRKVVLGLVAGAALGVLLAQLAVVALSDMLFGISGFHPLALGGVLLTFTVMIAIAVAGPLCRVLKLQPMAALRYE